jgi:hypothetical protein
VVLYDQYGGALLDALATEQTLHGQMVAWLHVSREYSGLVRASQELTRAGSQHLKAAEQLRSSAADLIARRLQPSRSGRRKAPGGRTAPGASLMIVDVLSQYAFMDAAGWLPLREPETVAAQLERIVQKGLYS